MAAATDAGPRVDAGSRLIHLAGVLEELHEAGEGPTWLYLALHAGAAAAHAMAGHGEWREMFFLAARRRR